MMDKRTLRRDLRAIRTRFAPRLIQAPTALRERLTPGLIIAAYVPIAGEADPALLVVAARAVGCILALPHVVDRATPIRFLRAEGCLTDGPFGLRQPPADAVVMTPEIILTPLVGFDRQGNRLGQGAGHYDRAFVQYPTAWRIGVAWSVQEVSALTPDAWDVPLHAIVTEQEWIVPMMPS